MAALSNVHAASILNTSLRSGTYYLALFLTDPTASGTGTEASGGGYARKVISFDAPRRRKATGKEYRRGRLRRYHGGYWDGLLLGDFRLADGRQSPMVWLVRPW